jgi:hypothetical protein
MVYHADGNPTRSFDPYGYPNEEVEKEAEKPVNNPHGRFG